MEAFSTKSGPSCPSTGPGDQESHSDSGGLTWRWVEAPRPPDTPAHRLSAVSIRCELQALGLHAGSGQSPGGPGHLWGMKGSDFEGGSSCHPDRYLEPENAGIRDPHALQGPEEATGE